MIAEKLTNLLASMDAAEEVQRRSHRSRYAELMEMDDKTLDFLRKTLESKGITVKCDMDDTSKANKVKIIAALEKTSLRGIPFNPPSKPNEK